MKMKVKMKWTMLIGMLSLYLAAFAQDNHLKLITNSSHAIMKDSISTQEKEVIAITDCLTDYDCEGFAVNGKNDG
jgi:hypothetical protein